MKQNRFYLGIVGCIAFAVFAAAVVLFEPVYIMLAFLGTVSSILSLRFAKKVSRKKGRTNRMKTILFSTDIFYETFILLAVLSLPIIPRYLVGITLASVFFSELFKLETVQKLKITPNTFFDREKRMMVLAASIGAYGFNHYLLFYGISIMVLLSLYSLLKMMYNVRKQV